jgi:hypothetical protein
MYMHRMTRRKTVRRRKGGGMFDGITSFFQKAKQTITGAPQGVTASGYLPSMDPPTSNTTPAPAVGGRSRRLRRRKRGGTKCSGLR